jgi:hypothetical protein
MSHNPEANFEAIVAPMAEEFRVHDHTENAGDNTAMWSKLIELGYTEDEILEMLGFGEVTDEV